jgi:hypothetical protein
MFSEICFQNIPTLELFSGRAADEVKIEKKNI